jgi:hypothetical protein
MNARRQHPRTAYTVDPLDQAREALRRGTIAPAGTHYGFGRRKFNRATVNLLVAEGTARKLEDGRVVSRAAFPTTMSSTICPRCHVRYLPIAGHCSCKVPQ